MQKVKIKFRFLEHKADAKFQAFGKTLKEAFANSALAMASIIVDYTRIKPKIRHEIKVKGIDMKSLLYNFLEELLFLLDTKNFLPCRVKITKFDRKLFRLSAVLTGDNIKGYETKSDIKAVTYSEMIVRENPPMVQVVCDI